MQFCSELVTVFRALCPQAQKESDPRVPAVMSEGAGVSVLWEGHSCDLLLLLRVREREVILSIMSSSGSDETLPYLCLEHLFTQRVGVGWAEESKNFWAPGRSVSSQKM